MGFRTRRALSATGTSELRKGRAAAQRRAGYNLPEGGHASIVVSQFRKRVTEAHLHRGGVPIEKFCSSVADGDWKHVGPEATVRPLKVVENGKAAIFRRDELAPNPLLCHHCAVLVVPVHDRST
jgi:hypothetical protein